MPERELLSLAYQGKLTKDPGALRKETERLLKHDRFDRFLTDFTESWLDLRDMDFTEPDKKLFPEFDRPLQLFMVEETEAFLRELIDSNLPATSVVKSDFAMLNERLAEHYEVPGVTGIQIRKVKLPAGTPRGGFLSQGSVLKVTANGTNTSPVTAGHLGDGAHPWQNPDSTAPWDSRGGARHSRSRVAARPFGQASFHGKLPGMPCEIRSPRVCLGILQSYRWIS